MRRIERANSGRTNRSWEGSLGSPVRQIIDFITFLPSFRTRNDSISILSSGERMTKRHFFSLSLAIINSATAISILLDHPSISMCEDSKTIDRPRRSSKILFCIALPTIPIIALTKSRPRNETKSKGSRSSHLVSLAIEPGSKVTFNVFQRASRKVKVFTPRAHR